ncbi:hypothetical protein pipiens_013327 [Culex pipiens pipiens]|uniref:Uncharacterized protein n=1 Tax=Culex pipiens pipiens TaxID=38569 RepID=A0ABD1CYY5_CULPP
MSREPSSDGSHKVNLTAQNTEFWITYPNGSSSAIRDLRHGKQHQIPTATEQFGRLRQDQVTSVGPTFLNGHQIF